MSTAAERNGTVLFKNSVLAWRARRLANRTGAATESRLTAWLEADRHRSDAAVAQGQTGREARGR